MQAMSSAVSTDAWLLAETATNPAAFAEFYERYEEAMLVFMLRRTTSPEQAADLTAEVFASALAGAKGFRFTGAPPAAWLFRIARNVLIDSYREARLQNRLRRQFAMPALTITDEVTEHLERLAERAQGGDALQLLGHLPAEQRAVIVAHILHDRGYDEIATDLQCSPSAVRKRVSRGLATLRRQLRAGDGHV